MGRATVGPFLALDTEDDSEGTTTIVNFYDGSTHTTFTGTHCTRDARMWIQRQEGICWACQLEYDLINVFEEWVSKTLTLQYVGAGMMRAIHADAPVMFYDTLRHWPASVSKMGAVVGLPKLERDFTSVEYCRRDTEIVWHFVREMTARYDALGLRLKATLPAMAYQLWLLDLPKSVTVEDIAFRDRAFFREGYYGGRVEAYYLGDVSGPVYHYDVTSLFPSVMLQRFPDLRDYRITTTPRWSREGMARVTIDVPGEMIPPLPMRTHEGIIYPYGRLEGTWTYPEIRLALARGAKIRHVHHAIEYRQMCDPFTRFIDRCWTQRERAISEIDRTFWKLMMNSLYGKFGQHAGILTIHNDREYLIGGAAKGANVIWSAYVTAYARFAMREHLDAGATYYTDTDSIFSPDTRMTRAGLGGLRHEGTATHARFLGNKIYVFGDTIKAKGIPASAARNFIRTGRAIFRKPARLRESRRRTTVANVWYEQSKEFRAVYTKRRRSAEGWTYPWDWSDYCTVHGAGVAMPEGSDSGQSNEALISSGR